MKLAKFASFVITAIILFVAGTKTADAAEGYFELRNRVGGNARCWAASVYLENSRYDILMSCRDLLYPGGESVFSYIVWAVPTDGGSHFKLGTLGLGKVKFESDEPFNALYVTRETNSRARTPNGEVVMQGGLQRIELLEGPAPAPSENELGTPTPEPIATPQARSLGRIFAAGGVLAFIAIFGVILAIFVITRK